MKLVILLVSRIQKGEKEIFEKVQTIISEQLGVEKSQVTKNANFANDLGADSLDTVELVMAIEEAFDIEIVNETAEQISASLPEGLRL